MQLLLICQIFCVKLVASAAPINPFGRLWPELITLFFAWADIMKMFCT